MSAAASHVSAEHVSSVCSLDAAPVVPLQQVASSQVPLVQTVASTPKPSNAVVAPLQT